ncbi:thioredoxin O2, mitochondrial-like isoform X2 [Chenopodium quinoa]|uniref:thioredoxin O2, mitochondrial-like isoform X2 n=1 Tax=Chenopodium quinoa TaxID=63459 RepID=UPI000B77521D|nr:thioredoxin O2, mitochondrial-like isoform X2 [Chenopodium quinoa]
MAARLSALRSSVLRPLLRRQQLQSLSSLITPQNSSLSSISQFTPPIPLSNLTIPAAACVFSSFSLGSRTYSSDSELYSNVVVVQCDDQLNDFLKKAEDESLQAIFYFTAVWCGPCQFLWPDMKKLSEGLPNVKFYKIDIDEVGTGPTISKLNISSVPTLHFFKNGRKAAEVIGADIRKIKDLSSTLYKNE